MKQTTKRQLIALVAWAGLGLAGALMLASCASCTDEIEAARAVGEPSPVCQQAPEDHHRVVFKSGEERSYGYREDEYGNKQYYVTFECVAHGVVIGIDSFECNVCMYTVLQEPGNRIYAHIEGRELKLDSAVKTLYTIENDVVNSKLSNSK